MSIACTLQLPILQNPPNTEKKKDKCGCPNEVIGFSKIYDGLFYGDLDDDGRVSGKDFSILASDFGTSRRRSDINRDGTVDESDLRILSGHFGLNVSKLARSPSPKQFGDLNGDMKVDFTDFIMLAQNIGGKDRSCDINGDSKVDQSDVMIMSGFWNRDISQFLGIRHLPLPRPEPVVLWETGVEAVAEVPEVTPEQEVTVPKLEPLCGSKPAGEEKIESSRYQRPPIRAVRNAR